MPNLVYSECNDGFVNYSMFNIIRSTIRHCCTWFLRILFIICMSGIYIVLFLSGLRDRLKDVSVSRAFNLMVSGPEC